MRALARALSLLMAVQCLGRTAEIQGVIADWTCTSAMVRDGREKTLKQNRACSLMKNFDRAGYGLITDDKKVYKLDDNGNTQARQLLKNTPDKDNLRVIVTGDVQGDTINVTNMSML